MADLTSDIVGSALISGATTLSHATAHFVYGSESAFAGAGVGQAGVAVAVTSFTASFAYNRWGWKVLDDYL